MRAFAVMTAEEQALHQLRMHATPGVIVAFGQYAVPVHARAHERGANHEHDQGSPPPHMPAEGASGAIR